MELKETTIRVGWAERDITPEKPSLLMGQFHSRVAREVLDPLTVTALVLASEDDADQSIMVSADLAVIDDFVRDGVRERVKRLAPAVDVSRLFLNATHTHAGPVYGPTLAYPPPPEGVITPQEYAEFMMGRVAEAVAEAWKKRKPGMVAWGYGQAVVGHNRRVAYFDGSSKMYGKTNDPTFSHIEGHDDHGVNLLFTFDAKRKLTGAVVNVACPSQCTENLYKVSADFWHNTREELRKRHGKKLFVLPQCAAAGDQSPHVILRKAAEERMLRLKGLMIDDPPGFDMAQRREIALRIAAAVDDVLTAAKKDQRDKLVLRHEVLPLELPVRLITEAERDESLAEVKSAAAIYAAADPEKEFSKWSSAFTRKGFYQKVADRFETQKTKKTLAMEAHIVRVGDVVFATNGYEFFLDFGDRIAARSRAVQTFLVQLVGPGHYIPTERAAKGGHYSAIAQSNPIGPEGGQTIVEETVKAINDLFPQ